MVGFISINLAIICDEYEPIALIKILGALIRSCWSLKSPLISFWQVISSKMKILASDNNYEASFKNFYTRQKRSKILWISIFILISEF